MKRLSDQEKAAVLKSKRSQTELAAKFGVSQQAIAALLKRHSCEKMRTVIVPISDSHHQKLESLALKKLTTVSSLLKLIISYLESH
jgi:hypothetical protein